MNNLVKMKYEGTLFAVTRTYDKILDYSNKQNNIECECCGYKYKHE